MGVINKIKTALSTTPGPVKKVLLGNPTVDAHIAMIKGKDFHHRPYYYNLDGEKYCYFAGGIIWPTMKVPGYALIVGVEYKEPNKVVCLWEKADQDGKSLFKSAIKAQNKLGKRKHSEICDTWFGDSKQLMSFVNAENAKYNTELLIADPMSFEEPDKYDLYFEQIKTSLNPLNKMLVLNDCNDLRAEISSYEFGSKINASENPMMAVAGWLLHSMLIIRPWEQAVEIIETRPTDSDELEVWEELREADDEVRELWE